MVTNINYPQSVRLTGIASQLGLYRCKALGRNYVTEAREGMFGTARWRRERIPLDDTYAFHCSCHFMQICMSFKPGVKAFHYAPAGIQNHFTKAQLVWKFYPRNRICFICCQVGSQSFTHLQFHYIRLFSRGYKLYSLLMILLQSWNYLNVVSVVLGYDCWRSCGDRYGGCGMRVSKGMNTNLDDNTKLAASITNFITEHK